MNIEVADCLTKLTFTFCNIPSFRLPASANARLDTTPSNCSCQTTGDDRVAQPQSFQRYFHNMSFVNIYSGQTGLYTTLFLTCKGLD
ncbi:hypothetical protein NPIL_182611 [Nephila pilipes]|uniref:Uncharacterized protein n=1 Tax=Nephila pilipes TaxID=299642 RepID=A0A8X6QL68_NEPPI|nr:hypothetical protein NPIL_182611 [Nephila pilipes]